MCATKSISLMIIWCMAAHMLARVTCTQLKVPCYFIFGDSISDNGNNNWLQSSAKANYYPYGVDFPGGIVTGRFSNGRNIEDAIAEYLGFEEYIPSFGNTVASPQIDVSKGVNYASGGSGIRSETGYRLGERISLDEQLINHQFIISRLAKLKGNETKDYLSNCLYTLNMGSNDYINNYFAPEGYYTNQTYTPEEYAEALVAEYSTQIQTLYNTGARKFAVFALGLLGCTPYEIVLYGRSNGSSCVDKVDTAALLFDDRLKVLVSELNDYLTDAKFIYVDVSGVSVTEAEGFTVSDKSCCEVGSDGMCIIDVAPCSNRSEYVFYDNFHTTEAVNKLYGAAAYTQILELLTFSSLLQL